MQNQEKMTNTQSGEMIAHPSDPVVLTTKQYLEQGNPPRVDEKPRDFSSMMRPYTDKVHYRFFEVTGNSMNDGSSDSLIKKDIIAVKRVNLNLWRSNDLSLEMDYVITHSKGTNIGQIREYDKRTGDVWIHLLNPLWSDCKINIDSISELYYVISITRRCRRIKRQNKSTLKI